jgi:hypothetical protein
LAIVTLTLGSMWRILSVSIPALKQGVSLAIPKWMRELGLVPSPLSSFGMAISLNQLAVQVNYNNLKHVLFIR